jgi:hypothetical protein
MFAELIKSIQDSVVPTTIDIGGESYTSKSLHLPPAEPTPTPLKVSGLGGLIEYIQVDPDGLKGAYALFVQVEGPHRVTLRSNYVGRHCNRINPIVANCDDYTHNLSFGAYQSIEAVIIALQSQFVPTDDRASILGVLGTLKDERVSTHADDGVTQQVTTRKGLAFGVEHTPVPRIVTLMPYRTFAEVDQPASTFILRLKQGQREGEPPQAALFEADGGRWKLEAIQSIREYLDDRLNPEVDPELNIPIIA